MSSFRSDPSRERIAAAAELLQGLWGDALPPGPTPWERIAADAVDVDDHLGELDGYAVRGDELSLSVLDELLSYVPERASVRALLSPPLTDRIRQVRSTTSPRARAAAVQARVLSQAIRMTGARAAALYRHEEGCAVLDSSLGMTRWERTARARIFLPGDGPMCRALQQGQPGEAPLAVPTAATRRQEQPDLELAPCVIVPFPSAGPGAPAAGAVLLIWGRDGNPTLTEAVEHATPLAAEAEHTMTVDAADRGTGCVER